MEKTTTTSRLSEEHRHIIDVVNALMDECDSIDKGGDINKAFFTNAISFIRDYADGYHHSKEEDILFTELARFDYVRRGPLEQMLREHRIGRQHVAEMERGLLENNKDLLLSGGRGYADLLVHHIFKEDHVLYPLAEQLLPSEAKQRIISSFGRIDDVARELQARYEQFAKDAKQTHTKTENDNGGGSHARN